MALRGGENFNVHVPAPVTLPKVAWLERPAPDDAAERKEVAAKLAEQRVVRQGQEALETVGRAASFSSWLCIGKALLVGKALAIREAGNDWGQAYSKIFSAWIRRHHFDRIPAPTRSVAIELAVNADQITAWRNGLPARRAQASCSSPISHTALACCYRSISGTTDSRCAMASRVSLAPIC
jgi:hypothetical protein